VIYFGVTFIVCRSDCSHGSPGGPTVALFHTNKFTSKFKYGYQLCRFERFRILHSCVVKFNPKLQYIHQPHSAGRFKIPILWFIALCFKYSVTNSYVVQSNTAVFLLTGYMFWLRSTIIRPKIQYLKEDKIVMYNTTIFLCLCGIPLLSIFFAINCIIVFVLIVAN